MVHSYGDSMRRFLASLQTRFPNFQISDNLFLKFPLFDQQVAQNIEEEEDEDEDADLGDD